MLLETLAAYAANRTESAPLPLGSAPYTSSDSFKRTRCDPKVVAKRWDHRFSLEGSHRTQSTLKASSRVRNPTAIISLGTARPAPEYYPWQSITIRTEDPRGNQGSKNESSVVVSCDKGENGYDLGIVLNYGHAAGSPQVLRFITEHVEMIHNPPYSDWNTSLTCGTTSAIEIVLRMLCNRGDSVLAEAFTYPGTIEAAKALGLDMVGIKMDNKGMLPDDLDLTLKNWEDARGPKPSVIYIIPSGQNPTGATQPIERRNAIYEIAEQHDLLILEDDPYYFIQLEEVTHTKHSPTLLTRSSDEYLQKLPPSYVSLDKSGRVLRLDATSKILAPGLRCGWITGCSQLIAKFINHTEMSTVSPSGPSQALLYKLLDETWGHEGFVQWLNYLSSQYRQRLETLVAACERYIPAGLCKWATPSAGLFLWIQIDWSQHPAAVPDNYVGGWQEASLNIEDRIYEAARDHGVLVSKGSWFSAEQHLLHDVHFRMTFAAADDDALDEAVKRFGEAIREEFNII